MKTGLTSVSFRKLSAEEVIEVAAKAGVDGIEWGSDVHVPPTNTEYAKEIAEKTREKGLEVISYGSYFYLGENNDFAPFIDTAVAMGTKYIRIWGGKKERHELSDEQYEALVEETKKIGKMAAEKGVIVSLEYHQHSITATAVDAAKFASDVDMPSIRLYWQSILNRSLEDNLADFELVAPYLTNVHVFNYVDGKQELLEAGDGIKNWTAYIERIKKVPGERAIMTEFCKGGLPESFIADAAVLNRLAK